MQGQKQLIDIRNAGYRPFAGVWIWVSRHPQHESAHDTGSEYHELVVHPSESIDRLDLRCVIGLPVIVSSEDCEEGLQRTVRALCGACVAAGAERVVGMETRRGAIADMIPPRESWAFDYSRD